MLTLGQQAELHGVVAAYKIKRRNALDQKDVEEVKRFDCILKLLAELTPEQSYSAYIHAICPDKPQSHPGFWYGTRPAMGVISGVWMSNLYGVM